MVAGKEAMGLAAGEGGEGGEGEKVGGVALEKIEVHLDASARTTSPGEVVQDNSEVVQENVELRSVVGELLAMLGEASSHGHPPPSALNTQH